ncbi:MAG: NUDIX hydrolase [Phycisphaerales bacterium]
MSDPANIMPGLEDTPALPYKIACLCDLRDDQGRLLLLHRAKHPNKGLCSPIGGKLEMGLGESPTQCAQREIREEAGIDVPLDRLHLLGLIAETAYEGETHWLLFYFRVVGPVSVKPGPMPEGELRWHHPDELADLPIPETDRKIIWPLVRDHEGPDGDLGFFGIHIDCRGGELTWSLEQSIRPGGVR